MFSPETIQLLSICVLIGVAAAIVACVLFRWRRTKFTLPQYHLYLWGRVMARILWRGEVSGRLPVPDDEGAIIVCNHRSPFDPAFVQLATGRVVHWMVAREYCEHPAFRWFFRIAEAIPVGRGGIDTTSTKLAIRYAQSGELVGLFPEGRLNRTGELLLPGRPGAALIALKARVPVIPCYVAGSPVGSTIIGSMFMPAKARLIIGQPVDISEFYGREKDREVLEELTKRFLCEIARLAGVDDYQPRLAGRHWKPQA